MFTKLKLSHRLLLVIGSIQIVIVVIIAILFANSRELIKSTNRIIHTKNVLTKIANIEKKIVELETGQRGYLLTGKEDYLIPFTTNELVIESDLNDLEELVSDNHNQVEKINQIRDLLSKKINELKVTIHLKRNNNKEAALEIVNTDFGKKLMVEIMLYTSQMRKAELILLEKRSLGPQEASNYTQKALLIVFSINVLLISSMGIVFLKSIVNPVKELNKGTKEIAKGNLNYRINKHGNDELGELSVAFNQMLDDLKKSTTSIKSLENEINLRKEVEKKLDKANVRLKSANKKLVKNEKILKESNKELEQFAYIASHDLQEPLKTIQMFIELALEDISAKNYVALEEYFEFIVNAAQRMSDKTSIILQYSKVGKEESFEEVNCLAIVNNIIADLEKTIDEKKAEIIVKDMPIVFAQKSEVELLFQNLISNALKYVPKNKTPNVLINSVELENHWQIEIKDNGIGIEEKHFDKIFEMFQRLHLDEEYDGTGIGLAMVKKIITHLNGEIWVNSNLNEGSTFIFTLPKP